MTHALAGSIIRPEETTSDSVALIVTGRPARNPALLDRMRQALLAAP